MVQPEEREGQREVTRLIGQIEAGHESAAERLLPLVYQELRSLAASYFDRERSGHTLQPTALVHEAFLRLVGGADIRWEGRSHFFALAARAMRNVLADHARARGTAKRGASANRMTLSGLGSDDADRIYRAIDVDQVLEDLADWNERLAKIVELRFFGGLLVEEVAQILGLSDRQVRKEWRLARAWLYERLGPGETA